MRESEGKCRQVSELEVSRGGKSVSQYHCSDQLSGEGLDVCIFSKYFKNRLGMAKNPRVSRGGVVDWW